MAEICLFFFVWVCNPQTDAQFTSLRVQVSSIYCPVSNGQTEYKCAKKSYRAKQSRHVVISTGIICALFVVVRNTHSTETDRQKSNCCCCPHLSPSASPYSTLARFFNATRHSGQARGIKSRSAWLFQIKQFLNSATNSLDVPSPI